MTRKNGGQKTKRRAVDQLTDEVGPWWDKNFVAVGKREVATWKGALIIMFVAGVAATLIWSAKVGFYQSSDAAPASTLSFVPATLSTNTTASFSLTPTINTGTNSVSIVHLAVTFDATKLALNSITPLSTFSTAETATSINNTAGTATVDLSVGTANPSVNGTFSIATLNFTSTATGSAAVAFTGAAGTSGAAADGESGNAVTTWNTATVTIANDTTPPSGGSITYTNGYFTTPTVALTVADGTDSGTGINTASRIVQRKSATLSAGTCGAYGSFATITPTGSYPNFTDATVATGNCYQYQYLVSDNAGNQATYTSTNVAKVDTAAPTGGSVTYTNGYYSTASVAITANDGTDAASGVNTASRIMQRKSATLSGGACGAYGSFATITPTGSYPNFTDATVATGNCYQYQYLVSDNAGNQATYTTTNAVELDTATPTGGSVTYTNGYYSTASVAITANDGTAASGINTGSRIVQRKSATLSAGTCGSYGSFATITPTGSYPNFTDATVATGNCYQYQYLVSSGAGKQVTYTTTNIAEIDTSAPTGGSAAYTNGFSSNHSITVAVTDGTETVSGVNTGSRIVQRRSAPITLGTGGTCGTYGSFATITPTGSYPSFIDATVATGNCYQYQYLVSDNAGNQVTYTTTNAVKVTYQADITLDGKVDLYDYASLHTSYGVTTCGNVADINLDCSVNYLDYGVLHSQYGDSLL